MGQVKREKDKREINQMAIDIARVIDEKTFLTMCQAYMMQNMLKKIDLELIPPAYGAKKKECFIRYQIVPFKIPTPEEPYDGETTDDLDIPEDEE